MKEGRPFKVIIVGGGIAGLTLANALERGNIDYVLLEARGDIAPQVGASIGILPNGSRIFDQMGMYETLEPYAVRPDGDIVWVRGKKINTTYAGDLLKARFGYRPLFMEREKVLRIMYENLRDKSKIQINARCKTIEHSEQGVTVKCEDGKEYKGDVVVGADGVHSFVRSEMRRYADAKTEELMKQDKKSLSAEYTCLFGISEAVDGIKEGDLHRAYDKDLSFMIIGGINRTYFFVFKKLAKRYFAPDIPKYSTSDAESYANMYTDYVVGGTNGTTKFGDIWAKRRTSNLVPTEEAHNEAWTFGRFACVGDSIHKMTPNAGAGGNASVESAGALANCIYDLVHTDKYEKMDYASVEKALKSFHDVRKDRMTYITQEANDFTRIEAMATMKDKFLALYVMPNAADFLVDSWAATMVGAVKLDFLPRPKRSIGNSMPFHPKRGYGQGEKMLKRAMFALPLLVVYWMGSTLMGDCQTKMMPFLEAVTAKPWVEDVTGRVPVKEVYTGIKGLDDVVKLYVAAFTPSIAGLDHTLTTGSLRHSVGTINLYAPQRLQILTFFTDITAVTTIWLIESCRRANFFTFTTIPLFFMIYAQLAGIGVVAPIFYFLHYIMTPASKFHTSDNRLVQVSYAKTVLPAIIIGYCIPTAATYWPTSSLSTLQSWNYVWQFFPVLIVGFHGLFARCVKDTTDVDKYKNVKADLPYLRSAYIFSAIVSAGMYWYVYAVTPIPFLDIFFKDLADSRRAMHTLTEIIGTMLKFDEIFCFLSSAVWTLLCFRDLKSERRLKTSWFNVLGAMALSTVLLGPGASFALMWWWREEILARKMDEDE
ncbi:FAD/NAD(P)-binding domain-containing protein [Mollisia scopiformis]|uniref:FAD/NAD(P)-binding domain-containing protein n=1 Tax=Mollisia scopiformis TaxID=149040 RepID=A0A194XIA8_MOLSC|nr:FAD/NAD(P)-binding domain-containing protein [Mollisia scopiformis]KUJ19502.1 FAD/NAD(P)-binding domain-containing protein [Mollisia scopiformis]